MADPQNLKITADSDAEITLNPLGSGYSVKQGDRVVGTLKAGNTLIVEGTSSPQIIVEGSQKNPNFIPRIAVNAPNVDIEGAFRLARESTQMPHVSATPVGLTRMQNEAAVPNNPRIPVNFSNRTFHIRTPNNSVTFSSNGDTSILYAPAVSSREKSPESVVVVEKGAKGVNFTQPLRDNTILHTVRGTDNPQRTLGEFNALRTKTMEAVKATLEPKPSMMGNYAQSIMVETQKIAQQERAAAKTKGQMTKKAAGKNAAGKGAGGGHPHINELLKKWHTFQKPAFDEIEHEKGRLGIPPTVGLGSVVIEPVKAGETERSANLPKDNVPPAPRPPAPAKTAEPAKKGALPTKEKLPPGVTPKGSSIQGPAEKPGDDNVGMVGEPSDALVANINPDQDLSQQRLPLPAKPNGALAAGPKPRART